MCYVDAELEAVLAANVGNGVRDLSATFVRKSRALQESRNAKVKTDVRSPSADNTDVRGQAERVRITREIGRSEKVRLFISIGGLGEFELEVAAILEANFVAECIGDGCVKLGDTPSGPDIVIAKAGVAEVIAGLRLDAGRRTPAHAIHNEARMIVGIDSPVDFGKKDCGLAFARNGSEEGEEGLQAIVVVSHSASISRKAEVSLQRASVLSR